MKKKKALKAQTTFLYRHYNKEGKLLYVGISYSSLFRTANHLRASSWSDKIATITIKRFTSRRAAIRAENSALDKENPVHNHRRHTSLTPKQAYALIMKKAKESGMGIAAFCQSKEVNYYSNVHQWKTRSSWQSISLYTLNKLTN